jgi:hypothetical protein
LLAVALASSSPPLRLRFVEAAEAVADRMTRADMLSIIVCTRGCVSGQRNSGLGYRRPSRHPALDSGKTRDCFKPLAYLHTSMGTQPAVWAAAHSGRAIDKAPEGFDPALGGRR